MKKVLFLAVALIFAGNTFSQNTEKEEIDYIQSIYGMEKKKVVAEFLQLNENQALAFWPIYDAYEVERKALGKKRIELLSYYEKNTETMTNEKSEAWMKEVIKYRQDIDKLIETYYKKVKKVTNPILAAQFYQVETYLLTASRFAIQDALPIIGGHLK